MREFRPILFLLLFVGGMFCLPPDAMYALRQVALAATTYYVQTDGNNANAGTSTGAANAWADPGYAASVMADGDVCYVKVGTYTLTSTSPGAGGPVQFADASKRARIEGYSSTPGDMCEGAELPLISAGSISPVGTLAIIRLQGTYSEMQQAASLRLDCNSRANVVGVLGSYQYYSLAIRCVVENSSSYGFTMVSAIHSNAISCTTTGFLNCSTTLCWANGCNIGFDGSSVKDPVSMCVASNNASHGFDGYDVHYVGCAAFANGGSGFKTYRESMFVNCISFGHASGYGWDIADDCTLFRCAGGSNASGRVDVTAYRDFSPVTLTENPWINTSIGDFRLNPDANEYTSLAGVGIGVYGQTDNRDIGAVQHADPAAGGGETSHVWVR